MELAITKFMRMMEVRSVCMMRFVKEFAEWYRKENHIHVELTQGSQNPKDYFIYKLHCKIYDDVEISEYDDAGRGHQLLRLVNSNLRRLSDILGDLLKAYTFNKTEKVEQHINDLGDFLGLGIAQDSSKIMDPTLLQELLDRASENMRGPINFFNGAGCYSVSGMNNTSKYMDVMNEHKFALINENEYKIAEAFFQYINHRESEAKAFREMEADQCRSTWTD